MDESCDNTMVAGPGEQKKISTFISYLKDMLARDLKSKAGTDVLTALTQMDVPDPGLILPMLKDPDPGISSKICQYLIVSGDRAMAVLEAAMAAPDAELRCRAIEILGRIGSRRAIGMLIESMQNADDELAWRVTESLKSYGTRCVLPLLEALDKTQGSMRNYLALVLAEINDPRSIEKFIQVLSGDDPDLCGTAALVLGKLGGARSIQGLVKALVANSLRIQQYKRKSDPKSFTFTGVQAHIAAALVKTGTAAVPLLIEELKGLSDPETAKVVLSILGKIGSPESLAPLVSIAGRHAKLHTRQLLEVVRAMESTADTRCIQVLSEILWAPGKEQSVYEAVIKTLQTVDAEAAELVLIRALQHENAAARFYAIIALETRKSANAIPYLIDILRDPNPLTNARAMAALEKFGARALPHLLEMAAHPGEIAAKMSEVIRNMGEKAIKKLQSKDSQDAVEVLTAIVHYASRVPKK